MILQRPKSVTAEQLRLAAELKELRLGAGIGSKWLRSLLALSHPGALADRRDFVFEVEYCRVEITPEVEREWRAAVDRTVRGDCPEIPNLCDLCGAKTGSWLHDTCRGCMQSAMLSCRRVHA